MLFDLPRALRRFEERWQEWKASENEDPEEYERLIEDRADLERHLLRWGQVQRRRQLGKTQAGELQALQKLALVPKTIGAPHKHPFMHLETPMACFRSGRTNPNAPGKPVIRLGETDWYSEYLLRKRYGDELVVEEAEDEDDPDLQENNFVDASSPARSPGRKNMQPRGGGGCVHIGTNHMYASGVQNKASHLQPLYGKLLEQHADAIGWNKENYSAEQPSSGSLTRSRRPGEVSGGGEFYSYEGEEDFVDGGTSSVEGARSSAASMSRSNCDRSRTNYDSLALAHELFHQTSSSRPNSAPASSAASTVGGPKRPRTNVSGNVVLTVTNVQASGRGSGSSRIAGRGGKQTMKNQMTTGPGNQGQPPSQKSFSSGAKTASSKQAAKRVCVESPIFTEESLPGRRNYERKYFLRVESTATPSPSKKRIPTDAEGPYRRLLVGREPQERWQEELMGVENGGNGGSSKMLSGSGCSRSAGVIRGDPRNQLWREGYYGADEFSGNYFGRVETEAGQRLPPGEGAGSNDPLAGLPISAAASKVVLSRVKERLTDSQAHSVREAKPTLYFAQKKKR
ncbi:unnamed protein product [Amoebophrya sp. A25]|nr:unnamed protein product [Amoebophrya sp. A25]|eukprot:GSA25T00026145001.1